MARRSHSLVFVSLCCLAAAACKPKLAPHSIGQLEVSASHGISAQALRDAAREALVRQGAFDLPRDGSARRSALRVRAEVAIAEVANEGDGRTARVAALLTLWPSSEATGRYEVDGLGAVPAPPRPDPRLDAEAISSALRRALEVAAAAGNLQLRALAKEDATLLREAAGDDVQLREAAQRVLSDRRNPEVVDSLIEDLRHEDDPERVRRAIGALIEVKSPKAVPALIELSRGRPASFVREILFAVSAIGGDEARAYLYTVAQGHDQAEVREAAEQALAELRDRRAISQ